MEDLSLKELPEEPQPGIASCVPCAQAVELPRSFCVALWTDSNQFAGTEKHLLELESALRARGVKAWVVCPEGSPLGEEVRRRGGTHVKLAAKGWRAVGAVLRVRSWLAHGRIAVVHTHNGWTTLWAVWARGLAFRGAHVASQHFIKPAHAGRRGAIGWLAGKMHRWVARSVDQWIAVSRAVRDGMLARGEALGECIRVVHHGLDAHRLGPVVPREALPAPSILEEGAVLLCVARLSPEKDHRVLFRACALLKAEGERFTLWLVGDGELRGTLEREVIELGLGEYVRFWGYQAHPSAWTQHADIVVLASPAEPFGLVVLEAMAWAKPVVVARAGGPMEVVEEGHTGLLFEPGDARDLALKIRALLACAKARRLMGEAGRRTWLERFEASGMGEQTCAIYRAALGDRGR